MPVASRPNIIFVLTDDLSTNLVSAMPHVVAMQKAGTSFSHYFVTDSLCCPSRASIFTGEFPHNTGVFSNAGRDGGYDAYVQNGNESKSFAVSLHRAGYRTGLMGKYLNQYDPEKDRPGPGWDEWDVAGHAYKEYNYALNENGKAHNYGSAPSDYLTDVLAPKALDFVQSAARAGQPFLLELATFAPHAPYIAAPRFESAAPNAQLPKTPAYDTAPSNPPAWLRGIPPLDARDQARTERVFQERIQADLATDELLGRLQDEIGKLGLSGTTYFVFNSDNGYHLGDYRLRAGKKTAFDTDIRVPLVVTGPGVPAGRVEEHMASNIDLAATFEAIAGLAAATTRDGVSLLGCGTATRRPVGATPSSSNTTS